MSAAAGRDDPGGDLGDDLGGELVSSNGDA